MRVNLPTKDFFLDKPIPFQKDYIIKEHIKSGMNAHMFKAYNESINNYFACKIIPKTNLADYNNNPERWKDEILKANRLNTETVVKYYAFGDWFDEPNGIDCVALCANFIKGVNLADYIKNNKNNISIKFICEFLGVIFEFFYLMKEQNVAHGDLHTGNIIVEDNTNSLRPPRYRFRITDFGVASTTSDAIFKDDYEQLAIILRQLLENTDYQNADPHDRYIYNILNNEFLARHLTEKDATRDYLAGNPKSLYEKLSSLDEIRRYSANDMSVKLNSPFDYPSLEQFGDSYQLLKALYSELFLGLDKIEVRNNLVLTGPRGCGKSTSFKSLSLFHKIRVGEDTPDTISYVGIYYRCDDLQFAFPRYKTPTQEKAYNFPIHFLTASLLIEILKSIEEWGKKYFSDEWINNEARVSEEIWTHLNLAKPNEPGSDSFRAIIHKLNRERKRAADRQRVANDSKQEFGYYFGPEILPSVCDKISNMLTFLHDLPFFFFIDDYSTPKVTDDLQKNLNRLLMQRTSSCFFKIATESPVSYVPSDIDGKNYVEGREFELLNLGIEYIHAPQKAKIQFLEDIFDKRFKAIADYPVKNLKALLGESTQNQYKDMNEMALYIREKRKSPILGGKDILSNLCSGDIHYIISLVGNMVQNAGGRDSLIELGDEPINYSYQNKAIREEAGNFLKNLVRLPGGERLGAIVNAFGDVAHLYLLNKNSKNEDRYPPHQASRIEPLEQLNLTPDAKKIYDELLRYSVFIEDIRGKSRRGDIVPRLYLRRFLIPHFNLTFSTRDSVPVEPHDFELLLLQPSDFRKKIIKRLKMIKRKNDELQADLNINGDVTDE